MDFDQDGWDDLTFSSQLNQPITFYRNLEGSGFEKVDLGIVSQGESKQVLWADFDNDGDKDLFVTNYLGTNQLFVNDGALGFEDQTETAGLPIDPMPTFGAVWGDYDRDGWLDLYISNRQFHSIHPLNPPRR